ncbi:MAG: hypothetical protein MJ155_01940 [Candidatus Saccharibacteria bacterium]|nr:hypothetical protein [Candidatus Saccharibacteria bacterium]
MSEGKHNKTESQGQADGGKWDQNWPPFQKSDYHEDTGDEPDESDEYRKKMEAMAKRGDDYDPLNDLEGESDRAQTRYHVDYHPRIKGENGEQYSRRAAWERMVREKSEEFPRESTRRVQNEDGTYSVENIHPDGSDETDAEWRTRVGIPSLEAYMKGEEEVSDRVWDNMTKQEKLNFVKENPRNKGESNEDWARRIGLLENNTRVEGNPADVPAAAGGEEAEETEEDLDKKLIDHYKEHPDELEELCRKTNGGEVDPEELQWYKDHPDKIPQLVEKLRKMEGEEEDVAETEDAAETEDEAETEDSAEEQEKLKHELLGRIGGNEDMTVWIQKVKGLKYDDLEHMTAEELQALIDEYYAGQGEEEEEEEEEEGEEEGEEEPGIHEVDDPLVAVNLNREKDARAAAHDIAEKWLRERPNEMGLIKGLVYRVVMGGMFREATIQHYEKQAYQLIMEKQRGVSDKLGDEDWATAGGIKQFVQAHVRGLENELIHADAGEKMDTYGLATVENEDGTTREVVKHFWVDEEGNRHEEEADPESAEAKATKTLHEAIAKYAENGDKKAFEDAVGTLQQELGQAGGNPDALMANNYLAIAEAARDRAEHGKAISDVMAGFRFINGEARSGARSEAHRDALDKITNRLTNSALGKWLPPEVVGAAAGAAVTFGKTGLRTALIAAGTAVVGATMAPAVVPLAVGMGIAGVTAAVKERNRVTTDRETQMRQITRGEDVDEVIIPPNASRRVRRRLEKSKAYGKEMAETQYETVSAEDLTKSINAAIESGDAGRIAMAFAQADTAIKMSDKRGIDLITYSSGSSEEISEQRMNLDIARAEAKVKLRELGAESDIDAQVSDAVEEVKDKMERDISAKDKAFKALRRRRAAGAGVKSALIAGAFQIGTQEVTAFFDSGTVGLAETGVNKLANNTVGHELTQNADDAKNTFLAGLVGLKRIHNYDAVLQQGAELTDDQVKQYENDPNYSITRGADKTVRTEEDIPTSEALNGCQEGYRSNWLGNGTSHSDGNELRGYYDAGRGVYTHVSGESWGGGQSFNLDNLQASDAGFVASMGGKTIWIPASGGNGDFVPDLSGQPSWVADAINGRHFDNISFVVNNGMDASGAMDCSSVWTFGGDGILPNMVKSVTETQVPTYDVVQHMTEELTRDVAAMPILPGVTTRVELPPLKPAKVTKPENVEGRPGTHWEDDDGNRVAPPEEGTGEGSNTHDGGGNAGGGGPERRPGGNAGGGGPERRPGDDAPESSESDDGVESPFDDSWGGSNSESDDESSGRDAEEAPAQPNPSESGSSSPEGGEDAPEFQPIEFDSETTVIDLSDDELRRTAMKNGETLSDAELAYLKDTIEKWNAADDHYRRIAIDGRSRVDHRSMSSYGPSQTNILSPLLEKYGLVKSAPIVEAEEDNG